MSYIHVLDEWKRPKKQMEIFEKSSKNRQLDGKSRKKETERKCRKKDVEKSREKEIGTCVFGDQVSLSPKPVSHGTGNSLCEHRNEKKEKSWEWHGTALAAVAAVRKVGEGDDRKLPVTLTSRESRTLQKKTYF